MNQVAGIRVRGAIGVDYGTRACNLKLMTTQVACELFNFFSKQPAGEKQDAQQDVDTVVGCSEV